MKLIYNNIIPFPGFKAINLFGFCFIRNGCRMSDVDINHEEIHTAQMKELGYVLFYIWYLIEWIINLFKYGTKNNIAYYRIHFEREAYNHEKDLEYLSNRKKYAFLNEKPFK